MRSTIQRVTGPGAFSTTLAAAATIEPFRPGWLNWLSAITGGSRNASLYAPATVGSHSSASRKARRLEHARRIARIVEHVERDARRHVDIRAHQRDGAARVRRIERGPDHGDVGSEGTRTDARHREDKQVAGRAAFESGREPDCRDTETAQIRSQARTRRQRQRKMQIGMVLEIAPDAAPVDARRDAQALKFFGRPDARTQQHGGGMDCTSAKNDLARRQFLTLATALGRDPDDLRAVEAQSGHARLRHHRKIGTPPHLAGEIAARARRPPVIVLRERDREEAVDRVLVDVVDRTDAA